MAEEQRERARLDREIAGLRAKRCQLDLALGEFLHEARRTRDALERVGGRSHALHAKARALKDNIRLTRRDLADCEGQIEKLQRRLAALDPGGATGRDEG
jgi:chromosome segregation ATPase